MFAYMEISKEVVLAHLESMTKKQREAYIEGWNQKVHNHKNDVDDKGKSPYRRNSYKDEGYSDARSLVLKQQMNGVIWDSIVLERI